MPHNQSPSPFFIRTTTSRSYRGRRSRPTTAQTPNPLYLDDVAEARKSVHNIHKHHENKNTFPMPTQSLYHDDQQQITGKYVHMQQYPESHIELSMTKWPDLGLQTAHIDSGGSPDVGMEIEVDIEEVSMPEIYQTAHRTEHIRPQLVVVSDTRIATPTTHSSTFTSMQSYSSRTGTNRERTTNAPQYSTIQNLLKFDPMQCFDIDELQDRMAAAQQKISDWCSLAVNNRKLKDENAQLREELTKCDNRIQALESVVLERNDRLKELLKENVFMRAQFKKLQNEFGVDAVKEVFNQTRG